jgi:hypothetical protein
MIIENENTITFSKTTWDELKAIDYFSELIEAIEDREALQNSKASTEYFVDLDDYHNNRIKSENV